MWPIVLVGGARVAAVKCGALGPRLAARFLPQRTPGSGLALYRGLHASAVRALPLIPIVVEQTVRWPGGDMVRGWGPVPLTAHHHPSPPGSGRASL
jgi:hypothetical protein